MVEFMADLGRRFWQSRPARITRKTVDIFVEIDAEQRSASFAYYALFSLVPMIALLLTVGSMFFSEATVHRTIEEFFPMGSTQQEVLWSMVNDLQSARGSVSVISIVILSWTSLRFFQALVRAVNRAWHTVEIPWWQLPLKNLAMVGVIGGGLLLGVLVPALIQGVVKTLNTLEAVLIHYLPHTTRLPDWIPLLDASRYVVGGGVLFYAFVMLYMLAPRCKVRFKQVWLSALLVSIILQTVQIAFVNYLPRIINYNVVYGSVGGLMLLLLWIYASGMIIIGGACFCAARSRVDEEAARPPSPPPTEHLTPSSSGN